MNNAPAELEILAPVDAQLVKYAGETGLEQSSTTPLVDAFRPIFVKAKLALTDAVGVAESVKDATCVTEIKKARACRLAIRAVRIEGEKVKKAQKATALTYGRAVDGFYNILEADLAPVEKALQDAEDTAERAEAARKDALEAGRKAALAPFVPDVSLYAVRDMTGPAFEALLTGVRVAKEQAEAAVAKAEADRIAKEKADAAERERVRAENERLKQEAIALEVAAKAEREAAEKKLADERAEAARLAAVEKARVEKEAAAAAAKAAQERAEVEAKAKAERERIEAQAKAEREAAEAIAAEDRRKAAEAARIAKEKAAAEQAKAKKAADAALAAEREKAEQARVAAEQAQAELFAKRQAEAKEAERLAAIARGPDREKLVAYWSALDGVLRPAMATEEGKDLMDRINERISALASWIKTEVEKL